MALQLRPETERLVEQELSQGHFGSVDEMILEGVHSRRNKEQSNPTAHRTRNKSLAQFLMESPLRGSGLNLERQKDLPRPIDL